VSVAIYAQIKPLISLDLRFKYKFSIKGKDAEFIADVINALNQRNVVGRGLDYDRVDSVDDPVAIEETESQGLIAALGIRIKI